MGTEAFTQADWDAVASEQPGAETPAIDENKAPPETPPEQVVETAPQQTETASQETAPPDPYANLAPEVQAKLKQFDQVAATMPSLLNELKEAKGRIGALQSQWDKSQRQAGTTAPTQTQVAAAAKDPEKWSALKEQFPEWGDAIGSFVESRLAGLSQNGQGVSQEQIEQLVAQRTEAATAAVVASLNEQLVAVKHPRWKQDINTPDFTSWFQQQPVDVQALAASKDGLDAIRMLDMYAEHKAKPVQVVQAQRQSRLESAVSAPVKGSKTVVTKSLSDMSLEELWAHEAKRFK